MEATSNPDPEILSNSLDAAPPHEASVPGSTPGHQGLTLTLAVSRQKESHMTPAAPNPLLTFCQRQFQAKPADVSKNNKEKLELATESVCIALLNCTKLKKRQELNLENPLKHGFEAFMKCFSDTST